MTPELQELIDNANTYETNGMWQVLKPLENYARNAIREQPKVLSELLRACIANLRTYPAIRVLHATAPARSQSPEWRPLCVKTYHDYVRQVGEEKAKADMDGLTSGFIQ